VDGSWWWVLGGWGRTDHHPSSINRAAAAESAQPFPPNSFGPFPPSFVRQRSRQNSKKHAQPLSLPPPPPPPPPPPHVGSIATRHHTHTHTHTHTHARAHTHLMIYPCLKSPRALLSLAPHTHVHTRARLCLFLLLLLLLLLGCGRVCGGWVWWASLDRSSTISRGAFVRRARSDTIIIISVQPSISHEAPCTIRAVSSRVCVCVCVKQPNVVVVVALCGGCVLFLWMEGWNTPPRHIVSPTHTHTIFPPSVPEPAHTLPPPLLDSMANHPQTKKRATTATTTSDPRSNTHTRARPCIFVCALSIQKSKEEPSSPSLVLGLGFSLSASYDHIATITITITIACDALRVFLVVCCLCVLPVCVRAPCIFMLPPPQPGPTQPASTPASCVQVNKQSAKQAVGPPLRLTDD
jgi:hypothetical protein